MNPNAPKASQEVPDAPHWLSARAAEIFEQLVAIISGMGIASASDTAMLSMVASRLEEVEICTAMIEDAGRTFVSNVEMDDKGNIISRQIKGHPAVAQRSEAMRHAQSLLAEFGLSPAARSKVSATTPNEENPFGALG
ncbi:phage terminase small subunit P27 family [Devosia sp.]|uniref:phage terminase small subunit P27 family n=1 Tax=Devosia sp. TaxID=1871048 RepID=UPI001B27E429|nr:phage terminase small subunit P27 family [Devosia sp.]MBO9589076.1 phage terminase small subunit P27 family [Devosia sp.]